jgi:hypothetical protein
MDRRTLLTVATGACAALPVAAQNQPGAGSPRGPALLTLTGAIGRPNRGPFDPLFDQLMGRQKVAFDKAHAFDFDALTALPAVTIRPTLEYDAKPHELSGPLLTQVVQAAGGGAGAATRLLLRAVDGYAVALSLADAQRYRFIVATDLDRRPMPLGGLGPLWAVFDADRYPDAAARPLGQRFGLCPWALYQIEVQAA